MLHLKRNLRKYSKRHSRKNLYEWLSAALQEHCAPDKTVLNIGAGGEIGELLKKNNVNATSIDIDAKWSPDYVMDAQDMSIFADNQFDVVVISEVLEHIPNPHLAVQEIRRVLKPGGVVIGSTPFILGIHSEPYDFYRYTRFGLKHLFRDFTELTLRERNGYFAALYVLILRTINMGSSKNRFKALLVFPIYFCLGCILQVLGMLMPSQDLTTGYFFEFRRELTSSAQQASA